MKWSSAAVIYYRGITSLDNGQFHPLKQNIAKSLLVKKIHRELSFNDKDYSTTRL